MRKACFAASMLLLSGCVTPQSTFLATGQRVLRVTCPLAVDGMATCFKQAGDICGPKGFVLYEWNGEQWKKPYPDPATLEGDPAVASTGLLVACQS